MSMQLQDLVSVSRGVASTRSRLKKRALLADCLRAAAPGEIALVVNYLGGSLPQGRIGLGPAIVRALADEPVAITSSLTLADVDDDAALGRCFATAADLLRRNLGGGRRVTRFERDDAGRLWVYGRSDQPCLRCDTQIASRRLGRHHRGTFWCPACQNPKRAG